MDKYERAHERWQQKQLEDYLDEDDEEEPKNPEPDLDPYDRPGVFRKK